MKIKDILSKDISNEQKLALEQVLNLSIPELILNKEQELTDKNYKKYKKIDKKLKKGLPIQYILKKSYFYDAEYYVNKNVLIPRPETEVLVEKTHNLIKKEFKNQKLNILDIGTGSGVIAITLYNLNNNYNITATDISKTALKVAKKNQRIHNTSIKFINTDLYKGINDKFDIIISNPPYIKDNSNKVEKKVKENEPLLALYGGKEGLDYYEKILKNIKTILNKKHLIAFEIGEKQGKKIRKIVNKYLPNDKVLVEKDYNGFDRYVFIKGSKLDE